MFSKIFEGSCHALATPDYAEVHRIVDPPTLCASIHVHLLLDQHTRIATTAQITTRAHTELIPSQYIRDSSLLPIVTDRDM